MQNQEQPVSVKTTVEKTGFLARLRTNKVMPLVLVGGLLFGAEAETASPKAELKKLSQETALLRLAQDPKVKTQERRLAIETFLDLQGAKGEAVLFSLLGKPNADETLQESIVYVLRRELVSKVRKGESPATVKRCLDILQDKKASPDSLVRVMQVIGWECVSDTKIAVGFGQDAEGKPFLIKGKDTPETLRHAAPDVFPLIVDQLGHADDTVRKSAGHELTGIILFADGDGKTLEAIRRLASDNSNPLKQKEAQNIVDLIDQLDRSTASQTVEEKLQEPPKTGEELPPSEYDKWIKILQDPENKLHWEAFQEILKLGGGQAVAALAQLAAQEAWARESLAQAISSQDLGEEYKQKAEVAKEALIDGIGALLKTHSDQAVAFLTSYPLYRQGGLGKYTGELMEAYFAEKSQFDKDSIAQFFQEMPREEQSVVIQQAFINLYTNDPVRQADTLGLLRNMSRENPNIEGEFKFQSEKIALDVLSDINNRSTLDWATKVKLLYYLPVNSPNNEAIANRLKSDAYANVRISAYGVLLRSGKNEVLSEMIKDQDGQVRKAGYDKITTQAYQLKEKNQLYKNEVELLYYTLKQDTDEYVRAEVVSNLTVLDLPVDEALLDNSPIVRVRGVYNLQERVRKGDSAAWSRLKEISVNEKEDGYVRSQASEFVENWEEWQKRKQEEQ